MTTALMQGLSVLLDSLGLTNSFSWMYLNDTN